MPFNVEKHLLEEKLARDDAGTYIGDLLVRQRMINEAVVAFTQPFLPTGSRVIDACAGPEGSWLAAVRRGYHWTGNDISSKFASILNRTGAQVVLSDFSNSPFKSNSVDAVFFIFALNNICNSEMAFAEAARITTSKGIIVETEPGLSTWVTKILLHSALSQFPNVKHPDYLSHRKFSQPIEDYFASKPYSETEYTDLILETTIGKRITDMLPFIYEIMKCEPRGWKIPFKFHEAFTKLYFEYVLNKSQEAGFRLIKAGALAITQSSQGWSVSSPVELATNNWLDQLMQIRLWQRGQNSIIDQLPPFMDKSARRIIAPILCMKKNEPT